jgi:hypothetical protein
MIENNKFKRPIFFGRPAPGSSFGCTANNNTIMTRFRKNFSVTNINRLGA